MKRIFILMTAVMIFAGVAGCSPEPRSVTMHEPGVYKGAKDPVLALNKQQELIDRARLVQSDR
jgi:hypothetical protein